MVKALFLRCLPTLFCLALCLVAINLPVEAAKAAAHKDSGLEPANLPTIPDIKDENLSNIWAARTEDLTESINSAALLTEQAENLSGQLSTQLQNANNRFSRLSGLFHASAWYPGEQMTLARQLILLRGELAQSIAPLADMSASLDQRLEDITQLKNNLDSMDLPSANQYIQTLALTVKKLSSASKRLHQILTPAKNLLDRMNQSVSQTEARLAAIWENYYLNPADLKLENLRHVPTLLASWGNSLDSRLSFAYPQTSREWTASAIYFGIAAVFMFFLGLLILRAAAYLPQRWSEACGQITRRSWIANGLGLSTLAASINPQGGIHASLALVGSLTLIAGIADLSWKLRITLIPVLEKTPSPLYRLYPPAAIGVLTLFADLPEPVPSLIWAVTSLVFSAVILTLTRRVKNSSTAELPEQNTLPVLERFALFWPIVYGLPSFLAVTAGYSHLAILLFMLFFTLTNILTLGSAAIGLLNSLAERLFDQKKNPVRNAFAEALSIPLACCLSLFAALPWFLAAPGARYLLQHALTQHYTLGEASFDFYKLLFIILLFFLCRSFIKLGKTYLTHISENMPQLERGVIPPLRSLFSYLLWTLFAIITLGLLGVNFTSLAVVAGGLSVGIGFGLQNLFNNLISGLILIFGRTLLVGDYVTVGGISGTVKAIAIRSTILETFERASVYVPNSAITSGQFTNWTRNSKITRRSLLISVAYGSDTNKVAELLKKTALAQEHVLKNPLPTVYFDNFGASSLDFILSVCIDDFEIYTRVMSELRFAVEKAFSENNIDIPFPQMTVHMDKKTELPPAIPQK